MALAGKREQGISDRGMLSQLLDEPILIGKGEVAKRKSLSNWGRAAGEGWGRKGRTRSWKALTKKNE